MFKLRHMLTLVLFCALSVCSNTAFAQCDSSGQPFFVSNDYCAFCDTYVDRYNCSGVEGRCGFVLASCGSSCSFSQAGSCGSPMAKDWKAPAPAAPLSGLFEGKAVATCQKPFADWLKHALQKNAVVASTRESIAGGKR